MILNVIYKLDYFSEVFSYHGIQSYFKYIYIYINFLFSKMSSTFFTKKFESFEKESILPFKFNEFISNHIAFDYPYNIFNYGINLSKIFLIFNHL